MADLLKAFDEAVAAELPRISTLQYNSREICGHFATKLREHFASPPVAVQEEGDAWQWVAIADRMPALGQSVALIDANGWENTGGDLEMNVRACGYFSQMGSVRFWSIRGERATSIDAFTHWLALPELPAMQGDQP